MAFQSAYRLYLDITSESKIGDAKEKSTHLLRVFDDYPNDEEIETEVERFVKPLGWNNNFTFTFTSYVQKINIHQITL